MRRKGFWSFGRHGASGSPLGGRLGSGLWSGLAGWAGLAAISLAVGLILAWRGGVRSVVVCLVGLCSGVLGQAPSPEIWRSHLIPGEEPALIVTGQNLWIGSCHDAAGYNRPNGAKNIVYVDGHVGRWDAMYGATGNDQNMALPWVQRVWIPRDVAAKLLTLSVDTPLQTGLGFVRRDNQVVASPLSLPLNRGRWEFVGSTKPGEPVIREIAEPIVIRDREERDFGGTLYVPAPGFRGTELVRYGRLSTLRNGRFLVPESSSSGVTAVLRAANGVSDRVHIDAVVVAHMKQGGHGIAVRSMTDCFIGHCSVVADRCFYTEPPDQSQHNIFYEVSFSGPRGQYDGQIGGGLDGRRNLVWRCRWHNLDRGPTGACFGSPLEQTVWWECDQYRTGWNQGAAEGKLAESLESVDVSATIVGRDVTARAPDPAAVGVSIHQIRVGYFVAVRTTDPAPTRWARITSVRRVAGEPTFRMTVDRELGDGQTTVRIGNAVVQNVIARSRFDTGKSGITFFGATYDTVIIQNQFEHLIGGIVRLDTTRPGGSAWHVGVIDRGNLFRLVDEPRVTIPNSRDWPRPGVLP